MGSSSLQELPPEPSRQPQPEKRYLARNLRSQALFEKIREAERRMDAGERELGFYLLDLKRRQLYREAGCSSFRQFVRLRTGITSRKARELVRTAKALESLPALDEAFCRGELYWSAVRAMATVATAQTDRDWAAWARGRPVAEVERRVAASKPGENPRDGNWGGSPGRYPYKFNVTPEVHQVFESLAGILNQKAGAEITVEEALIDAARRRVAEEIAADGAELLDLSGEETGEIDRQARSPGPRKVPAWELFSSQVLESAHPRDEHSLELTTPETPAVPKSERDGSPAGSTRTTSQSSPQSRAWLPGRWTLDSRPQSEPMADSLLHSSMPAVGSMISESIGGNVAEKECRTGSGSCAGCGAEHRVPEQRTPGGFTRSYGMARVLL